MLQNHYISNLYYSILMRAIINLKDKSQSDIDSILKRYDLLNQNITNFYGCNKEE